MLMVKIMRPPVKSRQTSLIEAMAGLAGLSVLLCVCLPEIRYISLAQTILLSLGLILSVTAAGWLASRATQAKSPLPAFETTASFTTFQSGRANQYREPNFGPLLPPVEPFQEPSISEKLRSLDRFQFVKVVELIFQTRGFWVKQLGTANQEGTVDLIVESTAESLAVHCKDWREWTVGVRQIGEFVATLANRRIGKGVFVTLAGCTDNARQLAQKNGIRVLNEADIIEMLVESGLIYDHRIIGLLADDNHQN